ncbi:unnamed protein product, partial [Cuscuta europaea]
MRRYEAVDITPDLQREIDVLFQGGPFSITSYLDMTGRRGALAALAIAQEVHPQPCLSGAGPSNAGERRGASPSNVVEKRATSPPRAEKLAKKNKDAVGRRSELVALATMKDAKSCPP